MAKPGNLHCLLNSVHFYSNDNFDQTLFVYIFQFDELESKGIFLPNQHSLLDRMKEMEELNKVSNCGKAVLIIGKLKVCTIKIIRLCFLGYICYSSGILIFEKQFVKLTI